MTAWDNTGDGGVVCSLVPLADMLNHQAGAGSLQFAKVATAVEGGSKAPKDAAADAVTEPQVQKAQEAAAQILATRTYRAGEQLHDAYVQHWNASSAAQSPECNLYLLWNFGFVEANDGGARGCAAGGATVGRRDILMSVL